MFREYGMTRFSCSRNTLLPFSKLGSTSHIAYLCAVIGFLRFIGFMNAAVWLGTAIFFTFGAEPACFSADMRGVLGITGESYYPWAIAGVVMTRYYHVMLACSIVSLLHFLAEWMYMGRPSRRFSFGLLAALFVLLIICCNAIEPSMNRLNRKHYTAAQVDDRESAGKSFRVLHLTTRILNVFMIGGLAFYAWRMGSPSDTLRFVRPVQFRG